MATQQLEIEILTVGNPTFTKTARGGYNSMELAFKNHSFDGKVEGKKLVDFNDKAVFEFFKGLKQGDHVSVVKEKGDNDQYWKWVGAALKSNPGGTSEVVSENLGKNNQASPPSNVAGRVIGDKRDFESKEERAERRAHDRLKHNQIRKQALLNTATAIITTWGTAVQTKDVIETAQILENFVTGGAFDDMKDDIPV